MKQCSWSWNTLNQDETVFMVMKHLESGWNSVHGHEKPWIWMKHDHETSWITWIRDDDHRDIYFLYWFLVHGMWWCFTALFHGVSLLFHAVSRCFTALSHAVSLLFHCCLLLFQGVHCYVSFCFTVFHRSVSWCFMVFHCPVSSCFMTMKQVQWERALNNLMLLRNQSTYLIA